MSSENTSWTKRYWWTTMVSTTPLCADFMYNSKSWRLETITIFSFTFSLSMFFCTYGYCVNTLLLLFTALFHTQTIMASVWPVRNNGLISWQSVNICFYWRKAGPIQSPFLVYNWGEDAAMTCLGRGFWVTVGVVRNIYSTNLAFDPNPIIIAKKNYCTQIGVGTSLPL